MNNDSSSGRIVAQGFEWWGGTALLVFALAIGGGLRFANLGGSEMSADEGASWAAASATSLEQVLELQPRLNPGKFAVHEIALHVWIGLFGDGLTAMRALSALGGMLGIIVVFFLARELLGLSQLSLPVNGEVLSQHADIGLKLLPASAAVLFAANLVFIKYAQETRMYSVALLCALLQVVFFLRSTRRQARGVLLLTALFTALAIASTFTIVLILIPEYLWLGFIASRGQVIFRRVIPAGLAVIGGLILLISPALIYLRARAQAPPLLAYAWASMPPPWAPISMFNKASGSVAFPAVLGLTLWGIIRGWRSHRDAIVFLLLWMLVPPIIVLVASYLIRPVFVERYLLASFVPLIMLVAFGIWSTRGLLLQSALLTLIMVLALGHVYSYRQRAHDVQWREAVRAAVETGGHGIAVAPPYAAAVVRYYLDEAGDHRSVAPARVQTLGVAIVADSGVSANEAARLAASYPHLVARLRGVIVRE